MTEFPGIRLCCCLAKLTVLYPKPRLKALVTNNLSKCICDRQTWKNPEVGGYSPGKVTYRQEFCVGWLRLVWLLFHYFFFYSVLIHKCLIINVEPILCSYSWDASNYLWQSVALRTLFLQKHSCRWLRTFSLKPSWRLLLPCRLLPGHKLSFTVVGTV